MYHLGGGVMCCIIPDETICLQDPVTPCMADANAAVQPCVADFIDDSGDMTVDERNAQRRREAVIQALRKDHNYTDAMLSEINSYRSGEVIQGWLGQSGYKDRTRLMEAIRGKRWEEARLLTVVVSLETLNARQMYWTGFNGEWKPGLTALGMARHARANVSAHWGGILVDELEARGAMLQNEIPG